MVPSGIGSVPVLGVIALGRLVANAVAVEAGVPSVAVSGAATMIVVGRYGAESVMVAVGSKLLPKVSETVVMMGTIAEDVVVVGVSVAVVSEVTDAKVIDSVREAVMLKGSVTVVGSLVADPEPFVAEPLTGTAVKDGTRVLSAVRVTLPLAPVSWLVAVVLTGIGSAVVAALPVPMKKVLFALTTALGEGVEKPIVIPVAGPVAEALMV